jgi:hypothetical protein
MNTAVTVALAALTLAFGATAEAAVITSDTLGNLILNHTAITSGDKVFSNFTYSGTNDMPLASGINVIAITDAAGNYGIRFQGGFMDTPGSVNASDALITYTVTVTDPHMIISDVHLVTNMAFAGIDGTGAVTETFHYNTPETTAIMLATVQNQNVMTLLTPYYKTLNVQKDILLNAGNMTGDLATLTMIDQTFSQVSMPEPASLALMALGGLAILRRRRP